ncbi:hypothetical protein llap_17256 [Limosa lapponica baueri]|uniref:FYN-binding protein 2 n=1 Tax=Limosa lapponica baueri TaxID=1758121 RepID=A0A2I0TF79_LIMLA|nr:hypothetical protein llap_17256 [Limosa lapponica baueri]
MYLNQSGDATTLCVIEVPKEEPEEYKTGGNEYVCPISLTKEDGRGGMKVPHGKQYVTSTQTAKLPTPQGLAKDGAEFLPYVYVDASKPGVEGTALNRNFLPSLQAPEDIYDDVGEIQDRLSQASDASSQFASTSTNLTSSLLNVVCDNGMPWFEVSGNSYEETYEDVDIGGDNPAKSETEKQKRFGNLFKIDKLRLKNTKLKENFRLFSVSISNLAAVSQEDTVYDDVEMGQRELREKDDKYKTWMRKFLPAKEDKDQRKSSDDVERKIFEVNKSNAEKSKKMEKEEKIFRETFMYDKDINVINTATAECSVPSKRSVDLPLTAGEQLDVIDVTEGSAVICRNSEGRYGYVLVEHLNFR